MAGFHTKTFLKHDSYMTPKYAWENIQHLIPKDKIAFYGDGKSGNHLKELGFSVIHEPIDFFTEPPKEWDMIVSNPPFSQSKEVIHKLKEYNKPFIIIMPCSKICTSYFRETFMNDRLQIVIPRKRIHFEKQIEGEKVEGLKNACNFDCFYYCWKMGFEKDIIWLG
jgi:hypothetical protein